jgi:hypothetical protein
MKKLFTILFLLLVFTSTLIAGTANQIVRRDSSGNVAITDVANLTTLNTLYIDANRSDSYTADGGVSRPYKTVLAALTVINADVGKSWILKIAPGTYSDNLTITGPRSLRIEGAGVTLSGTILINSGVGAYDRIEFVGVEGGRAEKGPAMTISGNITATRTNDSLIYVGFHGCLDSGAFEATTNGTWVLQYSNCRVNGAITGTFATNTQLDASILIEGYGFNEFVGAVTGIVSFYNVNGADIYANITTTPWFENRFTHTNFFGTVSMIPQAGANSSTIYVDETSYKSLLARTPTITGATYSQLGLSPLNTIVSGSVAIATLSTAQVSGTIISNTGQGVNDINHGLPAAATGYNFQAMIGEIQGAKYFRFTRAGSDTICLDGTCGKTYVQIAAPTLGAILDMKTLQMASTGIKTGAALAIGGTTTNVYNGAFTFDIAGTGYSKTATAAGTAPGNDVIPSGKYGAVAFDIGADGTIDVVEATANATGYDSAVLAVAGLAAVETAHTRMGHVTATKSDGDFTFGTTALSAANTTVAYTSSTAYTKPYVWIATSIKGTWATD